MQRIRLTVLGFLIAAIAAGCGGASSAPAPQPGKDYNPPTKSGKAKQGSAIEKFETVPLPPKN